MKFVFPFGDDLKQHVCPVDYRTLDGCCEPPNSMYTHSKRIGCCRTPNFTQTFGANTRCCTPEGTGQTRWGQTKDEPCGQLCSLPSTVLTDFGTSSCCPSCAGDRWNKTAENICGDCCTAPSSVSYVGAYSSCCAELPLGQNRWGQTTSSVCGGHCPPTSEVVSFSDHTSCCTSCTNGRAEQKLESICGTCCAANQELVEFEDNKSCCTTCTNIRYSQTAANVCGTACMYYCTIGATGLIYLNNGACNNNLYHTLPGYGKYEISYVQGGLHWDTRNGAKWGLYFGRAFHPGCAATPGYGGCNQCGLAAVQAGMAGWKTTCNVFPTNQSQLSFIFTHDKCHQANMTAVFRWTCVDN